MTEITDEAREPEVPPTVPEWRAQLGPRIDQLIGWAKVGQEPGYPAKARYYTLKAENADRLRDDILRVVAELVPGLEALTDRLWSNKTAKGFNTTDFPLEIAFLHAEVSEIFEAWRRGKPVGPEAADALLFLLSLARMAGVDLGAEAAAKMAVNEARQYEQRPNGLHVRKETSRV